MQTDHTKGCRGTMGNDFDRWLEEELSRSFARLDAGYVAPRYLEARRPRRGLSRLLAAAPALITAQVATAGIVVVAAASTGVAIHSVASGGNDPANWGKQVVQQVQKCKAELGADQHGIGQCVSTFASQHGDQQSDQNSQGAGNDRDGNGDDGNGSGHGQPSAHPTPQGKGQGVTGSHPAAPAHPTPPPHPTPNPNGNVGSGNNSGGNGGGKP